jgi:hypothetical protein
MAAKVAIIKGGVMHKGLILVLVLVSISISAAFAAEDTLTITTYYPSPYGSYNEMRAKRMAIGDNYIDHATYCWSGTCTYTIDSAADLIVEGRVGIGATNPQGPLDIRGVGGYGLLLASLWLNSAVSSNIYMVTEGGNVGIGTTNPQARLDVKNSLYLGTKGAAGASNTGGTLYMVQDGGAAVTNKGLVFAVTAWAGACVVDDSPCTNQYGANWKVFSKALMSDGFCWYLCGDVFQ